jgi:phosphoenolpyruvate synthase/pyruvate phosphate dikinase
MLLWTEAASREGWVQLTLGFIVMIRILSPCVWTVFVPFYRRPPVPCYCKSSGRSLFFGKDPQTEARRNLFGATQDAEWAWTDGKLHIVQSRDITSRSPQRVSRERSTRPETIHRTRSRSPKNELSEMLPQPTPAVPPEIGGWLSHRAIVAREYNVAIIVGTRGLSRVTDGSLL